MHNSRGLTGWKTEAKSKRKYLKLHISSGFENNSERNVKKKNPKTSKFFLEEEGKKLNVQWTQMWTCLHAMMLH